MHISSIYSWKGINFSSKVFYFNVFPARKRETKVYRSQNDILKCNLHFLQLFVNLTIQRHCDVQNCKRIYFCFIIRKCELMFKVSNKLSKWVSHNYLQFQLGSILYWIFKCASNVGSGPIPLVKAQYSVEIIVMLMIWEAL